MQKEKPKTAYQDYQIGASENAGESSETLAEIMRENSAAASEMLREMGAGLTPKKAWYSRLPQSVQK
jgi:hypothetical protein